MSKDFENNDKDGSQENFGLPGDYFQKSASSIFNKIEWLEEHKPYPQLSKHKNVPGFIVPANYFESSEAVLELAAYPELLRLRKESGFTVPENYFEELEISELAKVMKDKANELEEFSALNAVQKVNPFVVKEDYFPRSEQTITAKINQKESGGKIIQLFSARTWYSAAAAALLVTFGLWWYNQYFSVKTKDCGSLACVDQAEIQKARNQALESLDEDELYKMVDVKKLEENLQKEEEQDKKKESDSLDEDIIDNIY
jgi:hypothetical protein